MIYVISKATFGSYNVRDIQCNANWDCCPYSDYALIPDNLVEGILATKGYCDITLNSAGNEVTAFTARSIPDVPEDCCGERTATEGYVDARTIVATDPNNDGRIVLEYGGEVTPGGGGSGGSSDSSGYSPIKGVDYWTDEDKEEIVEDVLARDEIVQMRQDVENIKENGGIGPQGPQGEQGPQGPQGEKGDKGEQGEKGSDGYTPVRGVDYFNEEDIYVIKSYIDGLFVPISQADYDTLVEAGNVDASKYYMIVG